MIQQEQGWQEQGWVEAARRGDKQAFSQLVQAYQRPVYNLTYRMLGNSEEAEDAAQETFLRAYAAFGPVRSPDEVLDLGVFDRKSSLY